MKTSLTALTFVLCLAGASLAQDISDLPDDQLLGAVVTATETEDKERLMELMREVRARGLLMFSEPQVCEFAYPDTEFFRNEIFRGAVRWAYGTDLREQAMTEGYCGCIYELGSLDAFTEARVGKRAVDVASDDLGDFRSYRRSEWNDANERYQAFQTEHCGQ